MDKLSLKECILIDCISFTVVTILISILWFITDATLYLENRYLLELFCCTTLISIFMYFTSRIPIESQLLAMLLLLADVAIVILGVGGLLFQWFPWEWKYVLQVMVILVIVFFVTHYILLWQNKETARKINEIIKERDRDGAQESYH
jgi:hypothetical protein